MASAPQRGGEHAAPPSNPQERRPPLFGPTVAACALVRGDQTLVAQRIRGAYKGYDEVPGGKVERGESPRDAAVREMREELGVRIKPQDLRPLGFAEDGALLLLVYYTTAWEGEPQGVEGQRLRWVTAAELAVTDLPPADRDLEDALSRLLEPPAPSKGRSSCAARHGGIMNALADQAATPGPASP